MKWTTRIAVLFMIFQILFPGEMVHAITFIPNFIEHYNHHNEEHHSVSFVDFVGEHFDSEHHDNHEHHEQDNCPLNHNHFSVSLTYIVNKNVHFELEESTFQSIFKKDQFPPYCFSKTEFNYSIWQPPKIVQTV